MPKLATRQAEPVGHRSGSYVGVRVRTMAGQVVDLDMDSTTTVRELKRKLSDQLKAPPMCQRLLVGAEVAQDADTLASMCEEPGSTISLMLVVTLDEARRHLTDGSKSTRKEAVQAFAQVAPKGNRGAVSTVSEVLRDKEPEVRTAALQALAQVAPQGDARALAAATDRLKDREASVRVEALRAMGRMASTGGAQVGPSLAGAAAECLADASREVRHQAVEVLPALASAQEVVDAIASSLEHKRAEVRLVALKVLQRLNLDNNDHAVSATSALLDDQDSTVRQEAFAMLAKLVPSKDQRAVVSAVARLKNGRTHVRNAAMCSLAKTGPETRGLAVDALSTALESPEKGLKVEALKALAQVAEVGDGKAAASVLQCLEDPRPEVRFAALRAAPVLVGVTDLRVIARVAALCEHKDKGIKKDAQQVLNQLAPSEDHQLVAAILARVVLGPLEMKKNALEQLATQVAAGNQHAVSTMSDMLADPAPLLPLSAVLRPLAQASLPQHPRLAAAALPHLYQGSLEDRLLALRVLGLTAAEADVPSVEAVTGLLADAKEEIRESALIVLIQLAPRGCACAVASAARLLESRQAEVRKVALKALAHVAAVDDERTVLAVKVLAEDWDARVRHEALKTLAVLSPSGRENLMLVAPSAHRAVLAGSVNLRPGMRPLGKSVSASALGMLGSAAGEVRPVRKAAPLQERKAVSFQDEMDRLGTGPF